MVLKQPEKGSQPQAHGKGRAVDGATARMGLPSAISCRLLRPLASAAPSAEMPRKSTRISPFGDLENGSFVVDSKHFAVDATHSDHLVTFGNVLPEFPGLFLLLQSAGA